MDDDLDTPGAVAGAFDLLRDARSATGERARSLAAAVFTIFEDALGLPLNGGDRGPAVGGQSPGRRSRRGPSRPGLGRRGRHPRRASGRRLDCRGRSRRDHTSPVSDFERDTAIRRDGDGWTADLQPRWNVGNNPNGGYLLAIAVRAMMQEAGRPDPVTRHRPLPLPTG